MKYVFLINSICGVGGAQQYYRNKVVALKQAGFEVFLFHSYSGEVLIDDLKIFSNNLIRELKYFPYCFMKNKREKVIHKIKKEIDGFGEEVIIESSNIANAEWGEIIAKELQCKHAIFAVDEHFEVSEDEYRFLLFKLNRKELLCTSSTATKLMFAKFMALSDDEAYSFKAMCSNTVDDIYCKELESIDGYDCYIGVFGRLDKGYVYCSLKGVREYTEKSNKRYCVVVIGGANDQKFQRNMEKLFANCKNATLVITGFMYPVPRNLLKRMDVIIASAGCASIAARENVPTIYVNSADGNPVGILNYTIEIGKDYRYASNSKTNIQHLLNAVLEEDYCIFNNKIEEIGPIESFQMKLAEEIERQIRMVMTVRTNEYYDVEKMRPISFKQKAYTILGRCFGAKFVDFVHLEIFNRIFKT